MKYSLRVIVCSVFLTVIFQLSACSRNNENTETKMSAVIGRILKLSRVLQEIETSMQKMLYENPYLLLIENQLEPMRDQLTRVNSLLTNEYFIDNIADIRNTIDDLGQGIRATEKEYSSISNKINDDYEDLLEKFKSILGDWLIEFQNDVIPLKKVKITFPKMREDSGPPAYTGKVRLEVIVPILEQLVKLFIEHDQIQSEHTDKVVKDYIQLHSYQLEETGSVIAGIFQELTTNITRIIPMFNEQKEEYEKRMRKFDRDTYEAEQKFEELSGGNTFETQKRARGIDDRKKSKKIEL